MQVPINIRFTRNITYKKKRLPKNDKLKLISTCTKLFFTSIKVPSPPKVQNKIIYLQNFGNMGNEFRQTPDECIGVSSVTRWPA